ncbi:hypothetical protein CsSME_00016059 [Camellia sinensis var. sinensis]
MNNNSISGQIPPELSSLPELVHLLLDNNDLSGYLPPELANMPKLQIVKPHVAGIKAVLPENAIP